MRSADDIRGNQDVGLAVLAGLRPVAIGAVHEVVQDRLSHYADQCGNMEERIRLLTFTDSIMRRLAHLASRPPSS